MRTTTTRKVDDENRERLRALPGAMEPFQGEDWGTTPREVEKLDKNCLWPHLLELKVRRKLCVGRWVVGSGGAKGARNKGFCLQLQKAFQTFWKRRAPSWHHFWSALQLFYPA